MLRHYCSNSELRLRPFGIRRHFRHRTVPAIYLHAETRATTATGYQPTAAGAPNISAYSQQTRLAANLYSVRPDVPRTQIIGATPDYRIFLVQASGREPVAASRIGVTSRSTRTNEGSYAKKIRPVMRLSCSANNAEHTDCTFTTYAGGPPSEIARTSTWELARGAPLANNNFSRAAFSSSLVA